MNFSVELVNFRCHHHRTFHFTAGLCQLAGASGSGKSTVGHAIRWCLYDSGKKKIGPIKMKKAKTSVTVSYLDRGNSISITRYTHPKRLEYREGDKVYHSEEAQARIDSTIGPEALWSITSYAVQQTLHPFIAYGAAETTSAFFSLVDRTHDPKQKIANISSRINVKQKARERKESELCGRTCDHDTCPDVVHRDVTEILSRLEAIKERVEETHRKVEYLRLQEQVKPTPCHDLEQERSKALLLAKALTRRDELQSKLEPLVLDLTLPETLAHLHTNNKRRAEVERCSVEYEPKVISNRIAELKRRVEARKQYEAQEGKRLDLQRRISSIKLFSLPETDKLRGQLKEVEDRLKTPSGDPCPKCSTPLSVVGGRLVLGGMTREEEKALQRDKKDLTQRLAATVEEEKKRALVATYQEELAALGELTVPEGGDALEREQLGVLLTVVYVAASAYTDEVLLEHKRQLEYRSELLSLPSEARSIAAIEADIALVREQSQIKSKMKSLAVKCPSQSLDELLSLLDTYKQQEKETSGELGLAAADNKTYLAHADCARVRHLTQSLEKTKRRLELLLDAEGKANKTYADRISSTLKSINHHLDTLGVDLYDKDLRVQLALTRGVKGKTTVETLAFLDGEEIDVASISGGEKVRVSFQLLLACWLHRRTPFLLLDEIAHSMDSKWLDVMLELVAAKTAGYPCVVMSHNELGQHVASITKV